MTGPRLCATCLSLYGRVHWTGGHDEPSQAAAGEDQPVASAAGTPPSPVPAPAGSLADALGAAGLEGAPSPEPGYSGRHARPGEIPVTDIPVFVQVGWNTHLHCVGTISGAAGLDGLPALLRECADYLGELLALRKRGRG